MQRSNYIFSLIIPAGCVACLLLSACTGTAIRHSPVTEEYYAPIENQGQIPADTVQELNSRYPPGFHEGGRVIIPPGQEKKISIKPFSSGPDREESARSATRVFAAALARTNGFVLVERAQLSGIIDEFELNQSGLMDQDSGPETGNMDTADIIITGDILQMDDGLRLQARAVDMESGRVLLSEQSTLLPMVTVQSAEMLAARLISGLREIVYAP
jgi:curli biogenesis system outer membrane secretion channel CsgG